MRRILRASLLRVMPAFLAGILVFSFAYNAITARAELDPERAIEVKKVEGSFVSGSGVRTHYIKEGSGDTVIVFIHGFGGSTYSWRKNLSELARKYTVISLDVRGFGYTSRDPASEYSPRGYATHVSTFLDILGVRRPIIVGHSLGGEVAIRVALQRPEDVSGLVLIDSAGLPSARRFEVPPVPQPLQTTLVRFLSSKRVVRAGLSAAYYDPSLVDTEMVSAYRDPLDVERAEEMLWRMARTSAPQLNRSEIAQVSVPTLIIWGKQDRLIPLRDGEELAALIKGSRLVVLDRAGHMPQEERPQDVNALIDSFASVAGQPLPGQPRPVTPPPRAGPSPLPGASPSPSPGGRTVAPGPTGGLLSR
jgi:pimeloyl-ACP methyl ester carboxylesterase